MNDRQRPALAADVITSTVRDAIRDIPGVADLHRNPLQSLGERIHVERRGPVRLEQDESGPRLEIHIAVEAGAQLREVTEAVARAGATYLGRATGTPIRRVEVYVDDLVATEDE